ncbi:DNA-binding transcriptional LysR family regulator [Neorhizobium galegae]|uniref:LysR substrate-binding domain-containing protein n=1 Tax=Neorhizobium galegae TaxID=399 RepID=UPI00277D9D76|nr:LysR substrate-binding domain-containing protein [Neorhizobium galegae]MDQ0137013.1 DNA-binding transcriptional LysR family regulator [Neorhizobium galegae]
MDRLGGLTAFVRTADLGSFVAAGRVLGLSASAVGKAVTNLERELGVRLFQRSTRSLRLTEEGRLFHERCRRVLDDLNDAEASLASAVAVPRGKLRVSVPIVTYHLLMPVLPEFVERYPEVELDLDFNDRIVDLIDEEVDVAIRSGNLPDSRLMSRTLRPFQLLLCAAPSYLERHGTPECPRELDGHLAIGFRFPNSRKLQDWPITMPPEGSEPRLRTALTCNNMEALRHTVIAGLGIGCMPDFLARQPIADGRLRTILDEHLNAPGQFHLLWPSSRHLSPKVRVLVDFLSEKLFAETCERLPAAIKAVPADDAIAAE